MRRVWVLAIAMAFALGAGARAEPVVLTPDNMVRMTVLMLEQRRPDQALRFADALLQRDPQDANALILKSRAERDLGQFGPATATARLAWRNADSERERYGAARAVAQGLASGGQKFRAQLWLRRAIEEAPDARAERLAEQDFRYVRNRSRLSFRLDASARPSSNVNGGTSEQVLDFQGIPLTISPDSQALSGGRVQVVATIGYRLTETAQAKTDLRLGLVERHVWLSDEAKEQAPMADASDYRYSGIEVGLERAWKLKVPGGEATTAVTLGHNRYGGEDMSDYGRVEVGLGRVWKGGQSGKIALSAERQNRLDDPARSATVYAVALDGVRRLDNGDRLTLRLEARSTRSEEETIDHEAASIDVGWDRGRPVMGARLSMGLGVQARDYDTSALTTTGRQDLTVHGRISLRFQELDYMGFVPVMTIEAEHTESNVALNRSRSFGVGFGVVSKF
ncbi:MAG: tetratricopeptide repeat protein [Gemmobacter sp.]